MNAVELNRFRAMLESRRATLLDRAGNRNTITIENTADTMDEVRLAEERDLAIQMLGRDFSELRLVEAALARIKDGVYGSCLRCEDPIRSNRLCVMPHAAYCVACQEGAEQAGMSEFSSRGAISTAHPEDRETRSPSTPVRTPRRARQPRRNRTRSVAA